MKRKAWIIAADAGYGHQRAAYPFKDIAQNNKIITSTDKETLSEHGYYIWTAARKFYNWISRTSDTPIIGKTLFQIYDKLQKISPREPFRDLSKSNKSVNFLHKKVTKDRICDNLIDIVKSEKIPILTTFYMPAVSFDYFGVEDVWCVLTDTDIHRIWVAKDPKKSKIKYLAPCKNVAKRLEMYGIKKENIFICGFPLPKENVGKNQEILKSDLEKRLGNLDPKKVFEKQHFAEIKKIFGTKELPEYNDCITITFSVGGAGAQSGVGINLMKEIKPYLKNESIILNFAVGVRSEVKEKVEKEIKACGLKSLIGDSINIISGTEKHDYFKKFNEVLHSTDLLWTKPSELVFYAGLGLPLIMAPFLGFQESMNKRWIAKKGAGISPPNMKNIADWIFNNLNSGKFAEMALNGYTQILSMGTYDIEDIIFKE